MLWPRSGHAGEQLVPNAREGLECGEHGIALVLYGPDGRPVWRVRRRKPDLAEAPCAHVYPEQAAAQSMLFHGPKYAATRQGFDSPDQRLRTPSELGTAISAWGTR